MSNRTRWALLAAVTIAVLAIVGYTLAGQAKRPPKKIAEQTTTTSTTTTTALMPVAAACPLTGLRVAPARLTRQPIAVVIDNHPAARPHSGLDKADMVFEVVAEGGITRFLALYLHGEAPKIGPVRSVREYFADLAYAYGAALSHCGGAPSGYARLRALGLNDLDQFAYESAYWRDHGRRAPHNLYASTKSLRKLMKSRGFDGPGPTNAYKFKDDIAQAERPPKAQIDIYFSTARYKVRWVYDPAGNTYARYVGGLAHRDLTTGRQLKTRNVIVLFTDITTMDEKGRVHVRLNNGGRAMFFRDGRSETGTWERPSESSPIFLRNSVGAEVALNRGQTWFEILAEGRRVDFSSSTDNFEGAFRP